MHRLAGSCSGKSKGNALQTAQRGWLSRNSSSLILPRNDQLLLHRNCCCERCVAAKWQSPRGFSCTNTNWINIFQNHAQVISGWRDGEIELLQAKFIPVDVPEAWQLPGRAIPLHVIQTAEDFMALNSSQTPNPMAGRLHKSCAALIPAHEKLSASLSSQRNVVLHRTCVSGSGQRVPLGTLDAVSHHGSITGQQPIKSENTKLESHSDRGGEDLPQQSGTAHSCCLLFCSG